MESQELVLKINGLDEIRRELASISGVVAKLERERDELLAALKRLLSARESFDWSNDAGWTDAVALIARIEKP